jgi:FtsP/CotA-like multicopper oxidase with cupredoxin domain
MRTMDTTTDVPTRTDPPSSLPVGSAAAILAVLALFIAIAALAVQGDGDGSAAAGGAAAVTLSEFAIEPAALSVPAGGSLQVTNDGSVAHDLTVRDTDLTSGEIAAGESGTLDVSSLDPGEYEVFCSISGHEQAGMTATLTVTEGAGGAAGAATDSSDASGGGHAGHMTDEDYAAMDEAMTESIAQFPAETEGQGNQLLEPTVAADGTKTYELTAEITSWEVAPGQTVDAWTYNGTAPGPMIRVDIGDHVRVVLHNELPMGTDLHMHGINVDNANDGVAPATQDLIAPGESFTYEFTADEPAVAMYHAHHHAQLQVPNGMFGTIFVGDVALPRGRTIGGAGGEAVPADLRVAHELPLVLNDAGVIGYSLNGKSFPATAPIAANQGEWMLVHYFNEGTQIHPMHLHQFDQIVVAKDGFPLDAPYVADTVNVAPGERYSVLVHLDEPGTWVWHCHILNHVERETGMFGMVTAVVVE